MAGRRPKPTALKILQGNPGKRSLNANEPQPCGIPACPPNLDTEARKEWKRVSAELLACSLLTSVDRAILAAYCEAWSRWYSATKELRDLAKDKGRSVLVIASKNGIAIQNPLIGIINVAADQMRKFSIELGMTPAARSRINVDPAVKSADPFEDFMKSIGGDRPLNEPEPAQVE